MLARKFEDQVKKTPGNIAINTLSKTYTYAELNRYANGIARRIQETAVGATVGLLFSHGADMIAAILGALKAGKIYVPLTADYPVNRLAYMLENSEASLLLAGPEHADLASELTQSTGIPVLVIDPGKIKPGDENPGIEVPGDRIAYILYTSGSTGKPKGVAQLHRNVDYFIRNWVRILSIRPTDRMTLFSSFCHDASVPDIYSALHTGAALYPLNMKNRENTVEVSDFLTEKQITIWHSVPSLFSYFADTLDGKEEFPHLRYILLGGEAVRRHEVELYKRYFPHSTLANIYGQTESTVNSISLIDKDQRNQKITIGTPLDETRIFVLNDEGQPVSMFESGEILVASKSISPGYWKNPEADQKTFSDNEEYGRLYWTGDLGRLLSDGSIEFLGRRDNQLKIRGFRVEPGEIETRLLKHERVKEAIIVAREDKNGEKYIVAYIVGAAGGEKISNTELRNFLSGELPDYMIPTYFVYLEKMPLTPGGKIDRNALPHNEAIELEDEYIAPRDEVEEKLARIWSGVLGIENGKIGIDADFFQLGGHSLKATIVNSMTHKMFNVSIPLAVIFKTPTIRDLGEYIKSAVQVQYEAIEAEEKREYYPVSSAQQRFYMIQQMAPDSTALNMPQTIPLGNEVDTEKIENTFKRLIQRHESLRTSFITVGDELVQRVHDDVEFEIENYNLSTDYTDYTDEKKDIKTGEGQAKVFGLPGGCNPLLQKGRPSETVFIRPFNMSKAPLLRVGIGKIENEAYILNVDIHHIISDGTSQLVLRGDFIALYEGGELPSMRLQYRDFSQWQNRVLQSGHERMKQDEAFWLGQLSGKLPVLRIPTDFPRPGRKTYSGEKYRWWVGKELSAGINRLARQTGATLYMIMLAALNILLYRYTGEKDIIIGSPMAGRNHADLQGIIGLMLGTLIMRNAPGGEKSFLEFLEEVKALTLDAYEHQAYPFEELLKKVDIEEIPGREPICDIGLIVQNMVPTQMVGQKNENAENEFIPSASKLDFTLHVMEGEQEIVFIVEYSTDLFRRKTMERTLERLSNILRAVIKNPGIHPDEIDMTCVEEKIEIIGYDVPCYPLTHPQKRIYYTEKRYPGTTVGTMAFTVTWRRLLEKRALSEAINRVIKKNEGLRLRLVEFEYQHEPSQYVAPCAEYRVDEIDFSGSIGSEARLKEWINEQNRKPIDITGAGGKELYYFAYFKLSENESGYYSKFHHIIFDGWSSQLLFREIDREYEEIMEGKEEVENPNPSYIQYISDEMNDLNSSAARETKAYWRCLLEPLPEEVNLGNGKGGAIDISIEGDVIKKRVSPRLSGRIREYCEAQRSTVYKVLLGCLSVYILRVTGQRDFVIGGAGHSRSGPDHKKMIGMFVSTLPIRIEIKEEAIFSDFLGEIGERLNEIVKNRQGYPFDILAEEIREATGVDPLYLLNVNLIGHGELEERNYESEYHFAGVEPTPLAIHIFHKKAGAGEGNENEDIVELEWVYRKSAYTRDEIERIHQRLENILADVLKKPAKELVRIELLTEEEKKQVTETFNRDETGAPGRYGIDRTLDELFEEKASRTPDRIAVVGHNVGVAPRGCPICLTYKELNEQSDRMAQELVEKGIEPGEIVGIKIERSLEMIVSILGILKAGGAYLPIDLGAPQERIDYIIKDSGAKWLVTNNDLKELPNFRLLPATGNWQPATSLAYIIYTSGTTGRPKGVAVTHRNVVNYLNAFDRRFDLQPEDIVLQQASYTFDAFVEEMYPILMKGGGLAIPHKDEVADIDRLVMFIKRMCVTMITCSPGMLSLLNEQSMRSSIRIFISGGDRLKQEQIHHLLKMGEVYNTYGPTETTVCASYYRITGGEGANIPIGKPISGYQVYILDSYYQPAPVGVKGELCVSGEGVTLGYINNPELTAEKFIMPSATKNPFEKGFLDLPKLLLKENNNPKLYRTGDLARWLDDGNIEFLGRIDSQVKIRGFRIELGEIESRLSSHKSIKDAIVIDRKNEKGDVYLCAYIVSNGQGNPEAGELKGYISRWLPNYMIPSYFVEIERIPLTTSGKVDRRALPLPQTETGAAHTAPRNEIEEKLLYIWSEILNIETGKIGIDDNFFELGGHSLKAMILVSRIHKELNIKATLSEVFSRQTIRGLSEYIRGSVKVDYASIEPVEKKEYYKLSSAQKRIYFLQQMDLKSTAYNMPLILNIGKKIEIERIESALRELINRHESLRTSFEMVEGEPVQRIHDDVEFKIEYFLIEDTEGTEMGRRPFDLGKAPLIRSGIIEHPDGNYTWIVDMNHIISDGVSMMILRKDFVSLYNGEKLPELRLQYKDFSEWQNGLIAGGGIENQEDYWLELYKDTAEIPRLNMPEDKKRPKVFNYAGDRYRFQLEREDAEGFKALAIKNNGALYMNILASLNVLFYKYTGQTDIIIGTGIAGRPHSDLQGIIGMFVNTLAMRNKSRGDKTYRDFLKEVIASSIRAFENQDTPFEELVGKLELERDMSRNPLFDIMMTAQNFQEQEGAGASNEKIQTTSKFDMTFLVQEVGEDIQISIEYYTAIYKRETIARLIRHFKKLIKALVNNPGLTLEEIEIISEEEKEEILNRFNGAEVDYPRDKTICDLFEEQVKKGPDHIAVVGNEQITYLELDEKSGHVAHGLLETGVEPDTIVGIKIERSVEMIVGMLGILKSGGAYMPIDPDYPQERIDYMLKDSGAQLLNFSTSQLLFSVPSVSSVAKNFSSAASVAYIIYTSGTTGKPKGASIEHRNVVRLLYNERFQFDFSQKDTWTMFHSYCFDFSVWEMYGALLYGGKLLIIPKMVARETGKYLEHLKRNRVTVLNQTPSAFYNLSNLEISSPGSELCVRYVIFGGEALTLSRLKEWKSKYPGTKLINMYGITETTVHVTYKEIEDVDIESNIGNIGKPIPTLSVYIMDKNMKLQPIGVSGELVVGGAGVGRGYINNPELTAEKFISAKTFDIDNTKPKTQNPKLYRSGDLSRWLSDGNLEYLGRIDRQVKIRGYRIELGEIETRLVGRADIKEAVVISKAEKSGDRYLCAYIVSNRDIPISELREYLIKTLPDYMIPSYFVRLEKIPLTANGKVDRDVLPEPVKMGIGNYEGPRNEVEKKLVHIWSEVLNIEAGKIGIDDDFFELGGHSLKATIVTSMAHKEFNVSVPLAEIFKTPTIRDLGKYIKSAVQVQYEEIDVVEKREYYPLSFNQRRLYVLHQLNPGSPAYNMPKRFQLQGELQDIIVEKVVKILVERHESLRTGFRILDHAPVQYIVDTIESPYRFIDISSLEEEMKRQKWEEIHAALVSAPFNIEAFPLFRSALVKIEPGKYEFIFNLHHIISDGWSLEILENEFIRIYERLSAGDTLTLKPLTVQYKDFACWNNMRLELDSEREISTSAFWKQKLGNGVPTIELPFDFPGGNESGIGAEYRSILSHELKDKLIKIAKEYHTTLFTVMFSVYLILLLEISEQRDICCSIIVAGRDHDSLHGIVGLFVNSILFRTRVEKEETFDSFLRRMNEDVLQSFQGQWYPMERVFEETNTRFPVIPVSFNMLNMQDISGTERLESIETSHVDTLLDVKFDLEPYVIEYENGIMIKWVYRKSLFESSTIEFIVGQYEKLLTYFVQHPGGSLKDYQEEGKKKGPMKIKRGI